MKAHALVVWGSFLIAAVCAAIAWIERSVWHVATGTYFLIFAFLADETEIVRRIK